MEMKKYLLFFRLRFACGVQYRMAAVSALTTQKPSRPSVMKPIRGSPS